MNKSYLDVTTTINLYQRKEKSGMTINKKYISLVAPNIFVLRYVYVRLNR